MRALAPLTRFLRFTLSTALVAGFLQPAGALAAGDIPIMVDGLPLDARAIAVGEDVYVPAWILENYAHTKVNWMRRANVLEIVTTTPGEAAAPREGTLRIKVGFYAEQEGFVVGRDTRLFVLNVDPKELRFADGKSPSDRAHEGAVDRVGPCSQAMREYLLLAPTDRFSPRGWNIVARMPKEEIARLPAIVDRYELLYKGLFYDLLMNLVMAKEAEVNASGIIDESLRGLRIDRVPVREDGSAEIRLPGALHFLYARLLYRNRQVVWDLPVSLRGEETAVELSNRNAALVQ